MWFRLVNTDNPEGVTYVNSYSVESIQSVENMPGCCWLYLGNDDMGRIFCGKPADEMFNIISEVGHFKSVEWDSDYLEKAYKKGER